MQTDRSGMLLDHVAIGARVFRPSLSSLPPPSLWVGAGGHRLGCYVCTAAPRAVWVAYFHGNGELASACARHRGDLFTRAGVKVCFVEYPAYGWSDGEPALASLLADGERVVAALGVPAERVVAFGRSLGSLYAIELVRRLPGLAGLVIESGIADPCEVWAFDREAEQIGCAVSEIRSAMAVHFDHKVKLSAYAGPVLVLHAKGDRLVAVSHAERLAAWAGGPVKRLVTFPNGDHNTIYTANEAEYVSELHGFLRDVDLTPPSE